MDKADQDSFDHQRMARTVPSDERMKAALSAARAEVDAYDTVAVIVARRLSDSPDSPIAYGVKWHPMMPGGNRLVAELVAAASSRIEAGWGVVNPPDGSDPDAFHKNVEAHALDMGINYGEGHA